jgi:hypothetical protein
MFNVLKILPSPFQSLIMKPPKTKSGRLGGGGRSLDLICGDVFMLATVSKLASGLIFHWCIEITFVNDSGFEIWVVNLCWCAVPPSLEVRLYDRTGPSGARELPRLAIMI